MPDDIRIGGRIIGPGHRPFIIAEMSGNHNQSLARAMAIVEAAHEAGADAIKLQTYRADTMTLDLKHGDFVISDPKSLWYGKSLYELYDEAHTPWEWHADIFKKCLELGIICFSTPFDETAVEFLETLQVPAYKIASFENTDLPLIRKVAATGKPLIISSGMASIAELDEALTEARNAGCKDILLLKCTSSYPASPKESNLHTIGDMQSRFGVQVGLSDHTLGTVTAIAAVALGAVAIEKHFTLKRSEGGPDAAFSLEPTELKQLVGKTSIAHEALGAAVYGSTESEKRSLQFRRSTYVVRDIRAGETFRGDHLRAIRPGLGLPPKYREESIGRKAACDIKAGTPLSADMIAGEEVGRSR